MHIKRKLMNFCVYSSIQIDDASFTFDFIQLLSRYAFFLVTLYIDICARFKQMQRLGCTQLKAEVWTLPHQCINRLHTSALNCVHPSRCICLNRAQMYNEDTKRRVEKMPPMLQFFLRMNQNRFF